MVGWLTAYLQDTVRWTPIHLVMEPGQPRVRRLVGIYLLRPRPLMAPVISRLVFYAVLSDQLVKEGIYMLRHRYPGRGCSAPSPH